MKKTLYATLTAVLLAALAFPANAQQASSYVAGRRVAQNYAYGFGSVPGAHVAVGNASTGSQTVTVCPAVRALPDGRVVNLFINSILNPVTFDLGTASSETVTPTAVSIVSPGGLTVEADQNCAAITGSFSFTHAPSQFTGQVRSGSVGLQEAINDAAPTGGVIVIDNSWGGTNAMLTAAIPYNGVSIEDFRNGPAVYWNPQGGATAIATPATLTAVTALPSATPVGAFGTGTYHMCIAYVDILGQEGNCSADFSQAGLATGSFIFSAPAASTGAVGYTIYIGLTGGGVTNLDYKVPLITQPTVTGSYPVSNGICTLTRLELTTPACAVTNATYNQTGSSATVTAITLNTSQINPETTIISTTSIYVPNPGGRTAYTYVPSSHVGLYGAPGSFLAFPVTAAAGTTVPAVLGTVNLPPGLMNYVGRTIEVCGYATATATAATIENIQLQWDANGQNTAGKGVPLASLTATTTLATTGHISFCADLQTTVAAATATGGSINPLSGFINVAGVDLAATVAGGGNTLTGAVGSLNLADAARINVIWLHTTATDGAGLILQSLSFKVIN